MIASRGSSISGSGTVSIRTSFFPCQQRAFMTPFRSSKVGRVPGSLRRMTQSRSTGESTSRSFGTGPGGPSAGSAPFLTGAGLVLPRPAAVEPRQKHLQDQRGGGGGDPAPNPPQNVAGEKHPETD